MMMCDKKFNANHLHFNDNNSYKLFKTFYVEFLIQFCICCMFFINNCGAKIPAPEIIVHFDLKGAPPKLTYLIDLATTAKQSGATGILLEYEDMFCYDGELASMNAPYCYPPKRLKKFLKSCVDQNLTIIPLVQSFGHLEALLETPRFAYLAEVHGEQRDICPSKTKSLQVLKDRLFQVIEFHRNIHPIKYVHVGFDEVFNYNVCKDCRERHLADSEVYIQHLSTLNKFIKQEYPTAKMMFWADIDVSYYFNYQYKKNLSDYDLASMVPVNWDSKPKLTLKKSIIDLQHRLFYEIWGAAAFKGADGPTSKLPNIMSRLRNVVAWMNFLSQFQGSHGDNKFSGLILTGLARYHHFSPICDPLPAARPSLLLALATAVVLNRKHSRIIENDYQLRDLYTQHIMAPLSFTLNCKNNIDIFNDTYRFEECPFIGANFYNLIKTSDDKTNHIYKLVSPRVVRQIISRLYNYPVTVMLFTVIER